MSILRLAIVVLVTAVLNQASFAQNQPCNCNTNSSCSGNKQCLTAEQLWAGFAESQGCKGCVNNRGNGSQDCFGMGLGLGCGCGDRFHKFNINIPVPGVSFNWARPVQVVQPQQPKVAPECDSQTNVTRPKVSRPFQVFGFGKPKQVRNDIPNDHFGKLGESRSALQFSTITVPKIKMPVFRKTNRELPTAIDGQFAVKNAHYKGKSKSDTQIDGPPKPVIDSEALQNVEFAQHLEVEKRTTDR